MLQKCDNAKIWISLSDRRNISNVVSALLMIYRIKYFENFFVGVVEGR